MKLDNMPSVRLGLVAVSRDCFPISLSMRRRDALAAACKSIGQDIEVISTVVESETDMLFAMREIEDRQINALVVFLGNFGPETPETMFAQLFQGPVMYIAAAEGDGDLIDGRGDAYCGLLNCSYNLGLRHAKHIIPERPVGGAEALAEIIKEYCPVFRTIVALQNLKIMTFGPRPQDFLACNAPIQALYDLGIEIREDSELDLLTAYNKYADENRIWEIVQEMAEELKVRPDKDSILWKSAKLEATLEQLAKTNRGAKKYVVFANKCWPSFQSSFGCTPCYTNARLAGKGIPVGCEVDVYGALSQYIGTVITQAPCTLLDVNNTVPEKMFRQEIEGKFPYTNSDLFMGFHCGNTPICRLQDGAAVKYHIIMKRTLEPEGEPDITRGTLDGDISASMTTMFRLHSNADTSVQAYIAEGEILPVRARSFGGIGVFAIPEMERFYRNVLIEKRFPHHGAVAFDHIGKELFRVFRYFNIEHISYNQPRNVRYPSENPFV